jgi:hypothetical protein
MPSPSSTRTRWARDRVSKRQASTSGCFARRSTLFPSLTRRSCVCTNGYQWATVTGVERPAGVRAICGLSVLVALASVAFAILLAAQIVPLSSGAFLIGAGLEQLGPVAFLLYAALMLFLAAALWRRWRWARGVAILIALAGIAMAVPGLSSAVVDSRVFAIAREGLQIIIRVIVVYYLSQEPVKDWFARP